MTSTCRRIVVAWLLAVAFGAAAAVHAAPLPRPLPAERFTGPILPPDPAPDDEEPDTGHADDPHDPDDPDDPEANECQMACRSAALLPLIAELSASCRQSTLGKQLFRHFRDAPPDSDSDTRFWATYAREEGIRGFCFSLVLFTYDLGLDDALMEQFEKYFRPNH
jgi:hypothetical protein